MEKIEYEALMEEAAKQMAQGGAFLVTGEEANPMTIGWCQWGRLWNKPVCTVFVRQSRYSHGLIESGRFTVSVPSIGAMQQELAYCGVKSGRDVDKRMMLGLKTIPTRTGGVDGIEGCAIQFECKTLMKLEMDGHLPELEEGCRSRFYGIEKEKGGNGDPHTVYFAEILAAYRS